MRPSPVVLLAVLLAGASAPAESVTALNPRAPEPTVAKSLLRPHPLSFPLASSSSSEAFSSSALPSAPDPATSQYYPPYPCCYPPPSPPRSALRTELIVVSVIAFILIVLPAIR